jgi:hypothetical protein
MGKGMVKNFEEWLLEGVTKRRFIVGCEDES